MVRYSTVQYSTLQYSTIQYSTVQYSTVQYITASVELLTGVKSVSRHEEASAAGGYFAQQGGIIV